MVRPALHSRLVAVDVLVGLATAFVARPYVTLPSWMDVLAVVNVLLALATLGGYVLVRPRVRSEERPRLAATTLTGWLAIFVVALGPFGSPGPWWFGPMLSSWLSPVYGLGIPQVVGLALAIVAVLEMSVVRRSPVPRA